MTTRVKRRLDQALHDRAELLPRSHALGAVAEILKLHPSQISRMKARGWKALPEGRKRRKMPGDFEIQSAAMTFAQLCEHYAAGHSTIVLWFSQLKNRRPSWRGDTLRNEPRNAAATSRKSKEELKAIRAKQWETRRSKYGPSGYRAGAYARSPRRDTI